MLPCWARLAAAAGGALCRPWSCLRGHLPLQWAAQLRPVCQAVSQQGAGMPELEETAQIYDLDGGKRLQRLRCKGGGLLQRQQRLRMMGAARPCRSAGSKASGRLAPTQRSLPLVRWAALPTAAPPKSAAVGDGRRAPAAPWQLRPLASASRCPTAHCRWGDVGDPRFGDIHFYSYAADAFSPATYPPAKFVSEFGVMSLPSFSGEP